MRKKTFKDFFLLQGALGTKCCMNSINFQDVFNDYLHENISSVMPTG